MRFVLIVWLLWPPPAKTQEQACDQHQDPAISLALISSASRRALGSAPISEAARVTQVPTAILLSSRVDSTFLPWAPLPLLRRHAAAGAHFHKLARPSATARLRSHHEQQLLHSGLAWLGDQGVKSSSSSTASSTVSCLSSRSQHRFGACVCAHTLPCF